MLLPSTSGDFDDLGAAIYIFSKLKLLLIFQCQRMADWSKIVALEDLMKCREGGRYSELAYQ